MRGSVGSLLFAAALASAFGCADSKTRIVLITLDTLRYDAVFGPDGGSSMPKLRARADAATSFTRFYAASSSTQPTHATLFTALHPWEHGVTRNGLVLADEYETVAEALRDAGYETRAVVASFPLLPRFGFSQGFDSFEVRFTHGGPSEWTGRKVPRGEFFALADTVTEIAIGSVDSATGDRQFFWFHYFDAHSPYGVTRGGYLSANDVFQALDEGQGAVDALVTHMHRSYEDDTAFLDAALDRLFARLERQADEFETHVFVVSDHGESFGEGGSLAHGNRLSDEQIRVPAVAISPAIERGRRDDVAGAVDVASTLLSLAGVPARFGGRDLSRNGPGVPIFGMRKTWADGVPVERRLDGLHRLPDYRFFEVDPRGAVYTGNAGALHSAPERLDESTARAVVARFAKFEAAARSLAAPEKLDPESRGALEALGYGR